jgi:hypothetical protein
LDARASPALAIVAISPLLPLLGESVSDSSANFFVFDRLRRLTSFSVSFSRRTVSFSGLLVGSAACSPEVFSVVVVHVMLLDRLFGFEGLVDLGDLRFLASVLSGERPQVRAD